MSRISAAINTASTVPIIDAGRRLGAQNAVYPFLAVNTPLLDTQLDVFFDSALTPACSAQNRESLADYLVLASSWHLLEGWRFLSCGLASLLKGARGCAVHLGYYAELRAARSILASNGIGIQDNRHFALDVRGDPVVFGAKRASAPVVSPLSLHEQIQAVFIELGRRLSRPRPAAVQSPAEKPLRTHVAAWEALQKWAMLPDSGDKVLKALNGLSFNGIEWASTFINNGTESFFASAWLQRWPVDLHQVGKDQNIRHHASYGVSLNTDGFGRVRFEDFKFVANLSRAWLPANTGDIDEVGLCLIHDAIWRHRKQFASKTRADTAMDYICRQLKLSGTYQAEAVDKSAAMIADAVSGPAGEVLRAARVERVDEIGVLARAFLLLHLGTAMLKSQWREIAKSRSEEWVSWQLRMLYDYSASSNFPGLKSPEDLSDLADDQLQLVEELEQQITEATFNADELWRTHTAAIADLCRFERAFLVAVAS